MLHFALELDRRIYRDVDCRSALTQLRVLADSTAACWMHSKTILPTEAEFEVRQLPIRELRSGMVLDEEVFATRRDALIFKEGTVLTPYGLSASGILQEPGRAGPGTRPSSRLARIDQISKLGYRSSGAEAKT